MRALLTSLMLIVPAAANAASVSIDVRGPDGKPLAGAVVQVRSAHMPDAAAGLPGPYVVAQKNIAFQPHVLIVPVGASVSFPNRDRVRHHVYSFSAPKRFELKLYGQEEARSVTFDKPGVVALGCNIHDSMSGFVVVSDTPWAAQTDEKGHAAFRDVPPGAVTLSVWHPGVRAPGNMLSQPGTVAGGGLTTTLVIRR
ncbi:methylamine utilization protein [Sphingomonas tabacisoli]|uniref:Methylamine utilization protein n=1 Tax=Sphingomonas tabacisoli TaxID=2249466 RepID=A0ABW4HYU0_9SPHN